MDFSQSVIRALFVSQASRDMSVFIVLKIYPVYKHIFKDLKMCKCKIYTVNDSYQAYGLGNSSLPFFVLSGNGYWFYHV